MMDSIRMWALVGCFLAIAYVIYAAIDTALSEPLDDATIRQVYGQADGMVRNPKSGNLGEFLEKRLDVNYARVGKVITVIPDKPEATAPIALNKAQSIEYTLKGMNAMTVKTYEHKIIDIKFTPDRKFAYVSSTEATSGTINPPEGSVGKAIPFNAASACIDTLTLVRAVITYVRSECTNKIAILH